MQKQLIEYVWLGGSGWDFRGKTKVLDTPITNVRELSEWNYDGSSTRQAETGKSEILIKPVKLIPDPFRGGHHKIALCETFTPEGDPAPANFRYLARAVFEDETTKGEEVWFGIEQEYILARASEEGPKDLVPLAWSGKKQRVPQGDFYCGVGAGKAISREIAEEHLQKCLAAELNIAGINAEVFPGQWEFQIGICKGIDVADQLWLARYLLIRVCEKYDVVPMFDPKPFKGDWNGSGCHVNISTNSTRNSINKVEAVELLLNQMKNNFIDDILFFGEKNDERLTGRHETSSLSEFTWSVAGRHTSVRIPTTTSKGETGYFEDRRPAGNMDPYLACGRIADSMLLNHKNIEAFKSAVTLFKERLTE